MNKKLTISITIVALIAIGAYFALQKEEGPDYEFIVAERGNLTQEVDVSGRVKPSRDVELAFEKTGKINLVNVDVSDKVYAGEILASIDSADIEAQLAQAQANAKIQQAKLDELKAGTRPEEIEIQKSKVSQAEVVLNEAKTNLIDKIQDSYTKSDDAIHNKVDQFFSNPRSASPQIGFAVSDSKTELDIEWNRLLVESVLNSWKSSISDIKTSDDLIEYAESAKSNLDQIKSFLNKIVLILNDLNASTELTQTTIDGYRSAISTARTNINTATTNILSAEEETKTAESSLIVAVNELDLKKAGATDEQTKAQEAQLEEAEASVANYQAQLSKTVLRSPISGTVTIQNAKVGEIVPAGSSIISIISESKLKVESNIPEADIAKVKIGDEAEITLDAYEDDVIFKATVTAIEPAETIIEGVATYKTTLMFEEKDDRVKPGMTADINIKTAIRENVIVVPQRAVVSSEDGKIIRIVNPSFDPKKDAELFFEVAIKTGLRGSDGRIEILEGINEGDKVITFFNGKK